CPRVQEPARRYRQLLRADRRRDRRSRGDQGRPSRDPHRRRARAGPDREDPRAAPVGLRHRVAERLIVSAVKEEGPARTGSRRSRSSDREVVLVVDDEPQVLQLLKRVLERAGFETIAIGDGRAAHDAAVEWRPDIILLDLMLGSITGDQVLAELRKDFRTRLIPVVFLTVRSSIKDKVEHLMAGADDYVTKPFIGEELVARLRAVIMRATTTRELSPLTGMSGNSDILREIAQRLHTQEFACLYPDIDNFKSYNDHYGFIRGDDVIKTLASIILEVLE